MENQVLITEIIIFLNIFKLAQMKTPVSMGSRPYGYKILHRLQ